jgi:hypothetical protein
MFGLRVESRAPAFTKRRRIQSDAATLSLYEAGDDAMVNLGLIVRWARIYS